MIKVLSNLTVGVLAASAAILDEPMRLHLYGNLEVVIRLTILVMGGFAVGMMRSLIYYFAETGEDERVARMLQTLVIVAFMFWVYIAVDLLSWMRVDYITWRAPTLFSIYCVVFAMIFRYKKFLRHLYWSRRNQDKDRPQ